ncbi:MAG: EAL domain-containing protein [Alphaproteobacteria bacterium]
MRVWEVSDNKAIPTDLVREQDFILRVRRINRLGTPHLVVNLVLSALEVISKNRRAIEAVQDRLQEFAKVTNAFYSEMSNGDVFLIWKDTNDAQTLSKRIVQAIMPEAQELQDTSQYLLTYHLPKDYTPLRERANHYVEVVQSIASMPGGGAPGDALKSEAARGPLNAWSLDQIGKLLSDIDLRRYGRTQPIYQYQADGSWKSICEEYFISFEDLRRERFPKLEIPPEHLFMALCQTLDQRLIAALTEHFDTIADKPIQLNLAVSTILGSVFAQFARRIPHDKRGLVGFELNRGDLLQDFALTLSAIEVLKREGFKVAIDGVTPDMVTYINLGAFDVDYIKINVSKDRAGQLADPAIRKALLQIPAERLIFFRCDNEKALAVGLEMGVSKFQGWLIDDAVKP